VDGCVAGRSAAVVLLLGLLLIGCSDDGDTAAPAPTPRASSPSPAATVPAQASPTPATQRCENPEAGYALSFPAGWFVAEGAEIEPCTLFDPEPLMVPPRSEATGVAIRVDVRDVPFPQARQNSLSEGEKTAEDREVDGRSAARITGVLTEEVLLPAGTRITTWLVEHGGRTFTIGADDAGSDDYEATLEVLDEMVASLLLQ
jgi:hypothetical protein